MGLAMEGLGVSICDALGKVMEMCVRLCGLEKVRDGW